MRLDTHELHDLAAFFAKRAPTAGARRRLATDAGVRFVEAPNHTPISAWLALLEAAERGGRTKLLAHAVARTDPEDANLQEVCRVVTGSDTPGRAAMFDSPAVRRATVGGLVAALALLAWVGGRLMGAPAAPTPTVDALATVPADTTPALVSVEPRSAPSTGTDQPWKADNPLDAAPEAKAAAPRKADPVAREAKTGPVSGRAHHEGRCTVEGGGMVGFWYAGKTAPGAKGDTITIGNSVRVRADYPDTHNDFDARAETRCFLAPGDRVTLTADPLLVPGEAYWVPLHSGDLVHNAAPEG